MSELNWYWVYVPYLDAPNREQASAIRAGYNKVVFKSEADKVIAEKDEKIDELEERIDELQKATDSAWSKVNTMYDELRHNKYKRCLAMAKWCKCKRIDAAYYRIPRKKWEFYDKWLKRWLKIAEQFKEGV